jgi:hypothetical protein
MSSNNNNEDTELGRHIVRKDDTEYSIDGLSEERKPAGTSVINIVKNDRRSSVATREEMESKYESLVLTCMEQIKVGGGGGSQLSSVLTNLEEGLSSAAIVQVISEAKRRIEVQKTEQEHNDEAEKHRRFRERLQRYKDRCPDCGTDLGWEPGTLENKHRPTCTKYLDRIRREESDRDRKLAIVNQYERIQRDIGSLSSDCTTLRENLSNFKFIDAEALGSKDKDKVASEALEAIRKQIQGESQYEKGRRKWKVENMHALADSLQAFYAWFDGTRPNRESS